MFHKNNYTSFQTYLETAWPCIFLVFPPHICFSLNHRIETDRFTKNSD